ncbi:MAG: serine/threonine protein phosphatase, partial [Verrucomicrobiales bacterium]
LDFIFSGDQSRTTALKLTTTGDQGQPVTAMLSDYLSQPVLRLLRFVPAGNRIDALTYDVVQEVLVDDTPYVHELEQHQFTLEYPMQTGKAN